MSSVAQDLSSPFSKELLTLLDPQNIPKHVAIIMDGNRRWAKELGLPPIAGHWKGAETLVEMVSAASLLGIKTVTGYAFSTENWGRSGEEVSGLMTLIESFLRKKKEQMQKKGVRLCTIGDLSRIPLPVQKIIEEVKEATVSCETIDLVLAINYGGRDDIRRAIEKIVSDREKGVLAKETLTEEMISRYLDTTKWQDPELLIRTSGEMRLSNFLLWQISYSEVYVTETFWPDFKADDLLLAILDFQKRERRPGGK